MSSTQRGNAERLTRMALNRYHGKPVTSRFELSDTTTPGLRARVNCNGSITFVYTYRTAGGRAGSVHRVTIGKYPAITLESARQTAREFATVVAEGGDPSARRRDRVTVDEAFPEYLTARAPHLKPATLTEYRRLWEKEIRPTFGKRWADSVTREQVGAWHRQFNSPNSADRRPYVGNRSLAVLGAFYTWAEEEAEIIPRHTNPTERVKAFREEKRERYLDTEEVERLAAALKAAALCGLPPSPTVARKSRGMSTARKAKATGRTRGPYASRAPQHWPAPMSAIPANPVAVRALHFLLLSGWRVSEVLGLRWAEIDFERGFVTLTDSKTGRSIRPLGSDALALLQSAERIGREPRVFPVADLDRLWFNVRHAAGLDDVRLHDLRHTYASMALNDGGSLAIIGKLLGHRDTQSTARYAHLANNVVKTLADTTSKRLATLLGVATPEAAEIPATP